MAVKYKICKKKFKDAQGNPKERYYACKITTNNLNTDDLLTYISKSSSLSEPDALAAVRSIAQYLRQQLQEGNSVTLKDIGTFNLSLTSTPMDTPSDIKGATIKEGKVTFKADKYLRTSANDMHFTRFKKKRSRSLQQE